MNTKQRNKDVLKIEMLWLSKKKHTAETQPENTERERERHGDEQAYGENVRHCIDVG